MNQNEWAKEACLTEEGINAGINISKMKKIIAILFDINERIESNAESKSQAKALSPVEKARVTAKKRAK
jgi:hypothetical protein